MEMVIVHDMLHDRFGLVDVNAGISSRKSILKRERDLQEGVIRQSLLASARSQSFMKRRRL